MLYLGAAHLCEEVRFLSLELFPKLPQLRESICRVKLVPRAHLYKQSSILSNVRMRGFGSKAVGEGPERRLRGTALSARLSTKSRTMKSLLEKLSRVKLGPLGKRVLGPELDRSMVGVPAALQTTNAVADYMCVRSPDSVGRLPWSMRRLGRDGFVDVLCKKVDRVK